MKGMLGDGEKKHEWMGTGDKVGSRLAETDDGESRKREANKKING